MRETGSLTTTHLNQRIHSPFAELDECHVECCERLAAGYCISESHSARLIKPTHTSKIELAEGAIGAQPICQGLRSTAPQLAPAGLHPRQTCSARMAHHHHSGLTTECTVVVQRWLGCFAVDRCSRPRQLAWSPAQECCWHCGNQRTASGGRAGRCHPVRSAHGVIQHAHLHSSSCCSVGVASSRRLSAAAPRSSSTTCTHITRSMML